MSTAQWPDNIEELLVGDQMGLLEPAERDRLEQAVSGNPELQARRDRLADALKPLDAWRPTPAPAKLAQSVIARVAAAGQTIKLDPARADASLMPALMSLREVLAVAASILIIVGVFVPSYYGIRQRSQRALCTKNMSAIGEGVTQYALDNNGYLPFAGGQPGASWLSRDTSRANRASNTRHPYRLIVGRYVNPNLMVCPAQPGDGPISSDRYENLDDFESPNQISYSWQVLVNPLRLFRLHRQFAIAADRTPFIRVGRLNVRVDPTANSDAHGDNAGQNVLYPDGRVLWRRTPRCGVNEDNIFQAGTLTRYTGAEQPRDENDSFLVSPK